MAEGANSSALERAGREACMGTVTPLGLGSLYRVPAAPKLAVLCYFPALSLPALVERGDEQEQGGRPGCGVKPSLKKGLGEPSHWRQP